MSASSPLTDPIHAFLVKELREGVLVLDSEGRIAEANAAFVALSGRAEAALLGSHVENVFATSGDDIPLGAGRHLLHDAAGAAHPVELRIAPLPEGGRLVIVEDLTSLEEQAEQFRLVFDDTALGMAMIGQDNRYLRVNAALTRILRRPEASLVGASYRDFTHPDDVALSEALAEQLQSGRVPLLRFEKRYLAPDRGTIWVDLTVSLVRDAGGVVRCALVQVRDISTRRELEQAGLRAEAELRESDRRFRETMEAAKVAVWEMHQGTGVMSVSEMHRELFGLGPGDPLPRTIAEMRAMVHPDDRDEMIVRRKALSDTPGIDPVPFEAEFRIVTPAGDVRWMRTRGELRRRDATDPGTIRAVTRDITTEIGMRFALAESEERFRSAFDTSPVGNVIIGRSGETLRVNAALATMVGYDIATLATMRWTDLVHPDDLPIMTQNFSRILSGEMSAARAERRLIHRDGSVVDVSITSSAVRDSRGTVHTAFVQLENITATKAMRQAREEMEQRLELVLDATRDGIWDWDLASGHAYFGPQWFGMLGYPAEGRWAGPEVFLELIHPEDRAGVWAANERQVTDPDAPDYDHVFRMRCMDDSWAWIRSRGRAVARDAEGRALRLVGTHTNVSAQIEADAARRRSEERFGLVVEALEDGIWDHNLETGRGYISPRYFGMLGYPPRSEASYEDFLALVHPDDLPEVVAANAQQLNDPHAEPYDLELRMQRADGTWARIRARGRVVERAPDGRPLRAISAHTDVTAQRSLEEQYRQAQKMEAIGKLAGGLAHDFNNLLTAIRATTGILLDDLSSEDPHRADIEQIARAADRATTLTRQLLAFSRQEVERLDVVQLDAEVESCTPLLQRLLSPGQTLVMQHGAAGAWVRIDPTQLELALLNVVANARDAMPDGGTVTVQTGGHDTSEGRMVTIAIRDTGTGMPPEVRDRVFEPFFTTKPQGKGTGLGLPTVHGFAQRMGGGIAVDSTPGEGTTFTLVLPETGADRPARDSGAQRRAGPTRRTVRRVLVVDDDDVVRQTTRRLLTRRGYGVAEANGVESALDVLAREAETIDVVLSDYAMPGRTGRHLLGEVGARYPGMRTILMSGFTGDEEVREAIAGREIAFLSKPFTLDELIAAVEG